MSAPSGGSGALALATGLCTHIAVMEAEKKRLNADVARIDESLTQARKQLIAYMQEQGLTTIGGPTAAATLTFVVRPRPVDWPAFFAHVGATGEWDLVYQRVAQTAFLERINAGVQVPGVVAEDVPVLKITALR